MLAQCSVCRCGIVGVELLALLAGRERKGSFTWLSRLFTSGLISVAWIEPLRLDKTYPSPWYAADLAELRAAVFLLFFFCPAPRRPRIPVAAVPLGYIRSLR